MKRKITQTHIDAFKHYLIKEEKSRATIEKYLRDVCKFAGFSKDKDIDKALTIEYKAELLKGYTVRSANSMIAALNAFLKFIGWHDCCVKQFKIQQQPFCPEDKELTRAEYISLVKTAKCIGNERLQLILQTVCGTGIRISELEFITVEAVNRGEANVTCKGKSRRVFIVNDLRKLLMNYIKKAGMREGPVFVTRTGKPVNRSNVWREMKKICSKANVSASKVFPHNLRHLFARVFYEFDKDIAKLADILGHTSINTTRIYIAVTVEEHRKRMERMKLIL